MISFDITHNIPEGLGDDFAQQVVDHLTTAARSKWIALGNELPREDARDYVMGISEVRFGTLEAEVVLEGEKARAIEDGQKPWDIKKALLGPNAKNVSVSKKGTKYNTVPFRHGTPKSGFKSRMPQDLYAMALRQAKASNKRSTAIQGAGAFGPQKGTKSQTGYVRKQAKFEGLRAVKTGSKSSSYFTFRRVSENSPANSWMHPGTDGAKLIEQVYEYLDRIVDATVESLIPA